MPLVFLAALGFVAALVLTGGLTPAVRRFALRRLWTDRPDGLRKLHAVPTPSAGGLAIFAGVAGSIALVAAAAAATGAAFAPFHPMVYLGAVAMVATGAYDDIHGLGFRAKFAVQGVVAYALVHAGYRIDLSALPFLAGDAYAQALWALPLTVLWIVGVINAINLIDGLDGLAAGVAAIGVACLAAAFAGVAPVLVVVAACVVGALGGFLIHNFNPASIFMGDSGSLLLGYTLAVLGLAAPQLGHPAQTPLVVLLALGLPLLDTLVSMARRLVERRGMFSPDCDHIHHRMVARLPVRKAVLALYAVAGLFGVAAVLASRLALGQALGIAALTLGGAFALVSMLGYVRRPYAQPELLLIGTPVPLEANQTTLDALQARPPASSGAAARLPEAPASPDGAGDGAPPHSDAAGEPPRPLPAPRPEAVS